MYCICTVAQDCNLVSQGYYLHLATLSVITYGINYAVIMLDMWNLGLTVLNGLSWGFRWLAWSSHSLTSKQVPKKTTLKPINHTAVFLCHRIISLSHSWNCLYQYVSHGFLHTFVCFILYSRHFICLSKKVNRFFLFCFVFFIISAH